MARDPVDVLLYNPSFDGWPDPDPSPCAVPCSFTTDRARLRDADAVVFHVPTLQEPLPTVKPRGQHWVAWSMESEVTTPVLADPGFMQQFDLTMTYRRDADVWVPYLGAGTIRALQAPPLPKTADRPVCHFQSNPYDRSGRTAYTAALLRRVKINSYGAVLPTVAEPGRVCGRDARLAVMARHKFTLAFENSVATDYVSDKFFDALIAGSVPVYLGAPEVADFAPAARSYIDTADFAGPAELAAYLNHLDSDDEEYATYLSWRREDLDAGFVELVSRATRDPFLRLAELLHARRLNPTAPRGSGASPAPR